MKIATLCSGIGGIEIGARSAGVDLAWSIEIDPQIADLHQRNLNHTVVIANVCDVDFGRMPGADILHISAPCQSFAKLGRKPKETRNDLDIATAACRAIRAVRPDFFTLENVWLYRKSKSWRLIANCLHECGYWFHVDKIDFSEWGVPQSRQRMIVYAQRGAVPRLLRPPHNHISWHEATNDIIDPMRELPFWPALEHHSVADDELVLYSNDVSKGRKGEIYGLAHRRPNRPAMTLKTITAHHRLILNGKPRDTSPRFRARIQTIPDWFDDFGDHSNKTICRGLGNAVPSCGYQQFLEQLLC